MKQMEFGSIITADAQLQKMLQLAENVAASKATVLITGESGTGKELLARFIHDKSPRNTKRFVAINCAAIPEGLLESELFGYERGAFTGAVNSKPGKFELAHGSTILLDEISEMSLPLQAKLLRVLQEEEVERVGGRAPLAVNVRVVATTNRDLRAMVRKGQFREDLFYRLNVIPLNVPALRQRPEDVVMLAHHFMKVSSILNGRQVTEIKQDAVRKLCGWTWPGNVRELENVIERSVLMAQGNAITAECLMIDTEQQVENDYIEAGVTVAEMEKRLILKTLERTQQNRTQAAKLLGISIRTLRNKLHEYRVPNSNDMDGMGEEIAV